MAAKPCSWPRASGVFNALPLWHDVVLVFGRGPRWSFLACKCLGGGSVGEGKNKKFLNELHKVHDPNPFIFNLNFGFVGEKK